VRRRVVGALAVARALSLLKPLEELRDLHDGRLKAVELAARRLRGA
jgi:hypothetical protein